MRPLTVIVLAALLGGLVAMDVAEAAPPVCGDNVRVGKEQCDGTDAASCPDQCRGDCTCPSLSMEEMKAQRERATRTDVEGLLHVGSFYEPHKRNRRAGLAAALIEKIEQVLGSTRDLTDSEKEWLAAEQAAWASEAGKVIDLGSEESSRMVEVLESPAFKLHRFRTALVDARGHLRCAIDAEIARPELACWVKTIDTLTDWRFRENARAVTSPGQRAADEALFLTLYGHGLLQAIVVPYLELRYWEPQERSP